MVLAQETQHPWGLVDDPERSRMIQNDLCAYGNLVQDRDGSFTQWEDIFFFSFLINREKLTLCIGQGIHRKGEGYLK